MKKINIAILILAAALSACQKDFLAAKPDKSLLVPETLADFGNLMDNQSVFNISPGLGEISADDFEGTEAAVNAYRTVAQRNSYTWAADIFQGGPSSEWSIPYQQVFYANIVLDGLPAVKPDASTQVAWNTVKGSALFYRAFAFFNLVQQFAPGYDARSAGTDPGVPLRLTADVNDKPGRGTVQEVYDRVLGDLEEAEQLLPLTVAFKSRPSRVAALALLARVYLRMGAYDKALAAATAALALNHTLIDYNGLDATVSNPFPYTPASDNAEMIFYDKMVGYTFNISSGTTVSAALYQAYGEHDLRKTIFFTVGTPNIYKGRYTGTRLQMFGGLAADELYLVRAECLARAGATAGAMADLNTLLASRWATGTFVQLVATDAGNALSIILAERRKELVFRGLRWEDLKRLNKDPAYARVLTRVLNGVTYTLSPGDKRYVFPIPDQEVKLSGIAQNER